VFTGLIESIGRVVASRPVGGGLRLAIESERPLESLQLGESIAVDGVCLTVTTFAGDRRFEVDVSAESVERSTLGGRGIGDRVHLERALQLGARLGGHLVSGHVDGRGTLVERAEAGASWRLTFQVAPEVAALMVPKGSVAIDGVSLTINELGDDRLTVNVIPHTGGETTLVSRTVGDPVNIEVDQLAKMVRRMLAPYLESGPSQPSGDISLDLLARSGFIKTPSGGLGGAGRS